MSKLGTGITISFSSGFLAQIENVDWAGMHREAIRSSHHGTTNWHTFEPANLVDPGELRIGIRFAAETDPPIDSAAETITVTIPSDGAGGDSTWAASGFMTDFEWGVPFEEFQRATATLKLSGAVTVTP